MTLPRNMIIFFVISLLLFYTYNFIEDFKDFKNFVNREYLSFKNFLFELYNVKKRENVALTENYIREISKKLGIEMKELVYENGKYRMRIKKVEFRELILFLERISKGGEVELVRLVDNTGKGIFEAELILKPF
ncbi:hypothetical protein JCM9492_16430 [Aquifex pyrophilus]